MGVDRVGVEPARERAPLLEQQQQVPPIMLHPHLERHKLGEQPAGEREPLGVRAVERRRRRRRLALAASASAELGRARRARSQCWWREQPRLAALTQLQRGRVGGLRALDGLCVLVREQR
jgi:hypothetical protein